MYEHRSEKLLPVRQFYGRLFAHAMFAFGLLGFSLGLGIVGYHITERLSWLDSLLNASMILGGMGPVNALQTPSGKVFASFYALYAGIVFLASVGIIVAPVVHRIAHRLHLEEANTDS